MKASASTYAEPAVYHAADWPAVRPIWSEVAQASPYSSFYLSATWVESWLDVFGKRLDPEILVFRCNNAAVGACMLVYRRERRGPVPVRRVYLGTGGEQEDEETCAELNNLLCLPGTETAVVNALQAHLSERSWDELHARGFSDGLPLDLLCGQYAAFHVLREERPAYCVDLAELRARGAAYLSALSHSSRRQVGRSIRLYDAMGGLSVHCPESLDEALRVFAEMLPIHRAAWQSRGKPASFSSEAQIEFHRRVITRGFPEGHVQLFRVSAGKQPIAILYNYVWRRKTFCHQWGLQYADDKRLHPGLVAIALCIEQCVQTELDDFDLSAGNARYKESLATGCRKMTWLTIQQPSVKMRAIERLRSLKRLVS